MVMRSLMMFLMAGTVCAAPESFEAIQAGAGISQYKVGYGSWQTSADSAVVITGHSKTGSQSLHLKGGEDQSVELMFKQPLAEEMWLSFWSERWTSRAPFEYVLEVKIGGKWRTKKDLSSETKLGDFHARTGLLLEQGTEGLRWVATTPENTGVLIDDVWVQKLKPMMVSNIETMQPVVPVLVGKSVNPVVGFTVYTDGRTEPKTVEEFQLSLAGTVRIQDIKSVSVLYAGNEEEPGAGKVIATSSDIAEMMTLKGSATLESGRNQFWVSVSLKDTASLDGAVDAGVAKIRLADGAELKPSVVSPEGAQRIGVALRQHGDDGSKAFRIPGMVTTNKGTLIAVYDARWNGGGDLPGNIDVGMSRSTDGGQSWEDMKIIMDMGNDPKWHHDGIGDPAVLVDRSNNRIWVAGVWSHGNRAWHGSGQGMKPEETGQFMLVYSEDDGKSWSKPMNITEQVKKPEWHYMLQGPGAGITMKNGTLVFAAQYQDGDKNADGKKVGTPYSTIIYSKDHGKTWQAGNGIKSNTTEAQVVELGDGSLMLNCRDNRGSYRTIGLTYDLGKTWELHPTDREALNEPICMASLYRFEREGEADLLLFSNPNTQSGRNHMSIKVSDDEGLTWPSKWHSLYDVRSCSGYSCLTRIGNDKVGVLYEGPHEIYFLRFTLEELLRESK